MPTSESTSTGQSASVRSTQWRLARRPHGEPDADTFEQVTVDVPEPGDGQVLLEITHLSLDPYMRGRLSAARSYAAPIEVGDVVVGGTVGRVLTSRHEGLGPGDYVLSYSGWQTHALADGDAVRRLDPAQAPVTTALGVLGMPGFTAYAGLLGIGRPKPGETVVVAAATGPVGSAVGQIAKIHGARAVGIAGGPLKTRLLTERFGFDAAVDHRAEDFADRLAEAVPEGIDVYFENVGGHVLEQVSRHLNDFARIPVCGLVAGYNATEAPAGPDQLPGFMGLVLSRRLTLRGFIQNELWDEYGGDFVRDMGGWVADGQVAYLEDVVEGLDRAPEAFAGMLRGENLGKLIVQVA